MNLPATSQRLSFPIYTLAALATIVIALALIAWIAGAPTDCATYVKQYESAQASYLPQPQSAKERYEECQRTGSMFLTREAK